MPSTQLVLKKYSLNSQIQWLELCLAYGRSSLWRKQWDLSSARRHWLEAGTLLCFSFPPTPTPPPPRPCIPSAQAGGSCPTAGGGGGGETPAGSWSDSVSLAFECYSRQFLWFTAVPGTVMAVSINIGDSQWPLRLAGLFGPSCSKNPVQAIVIPASV